MSEKNLPEGHSREDYEACCEYAEEHGYWGMYTAMVEDGYSDDVNWRELMK